VVREGRGGVPEWLRTRRLSMLLTGVAMLCAVGAFVDALAAGASHGTRRYVLMGVGGFLTACGILLTAVERWRSEQARRTAMQVAIDTAEELMVTLNGALAPITSYLGDLAVAPGLVERQAILGQLRQAVVDAAVRLTVAESRSTLYVMEASGDALVRSAYAGRSALPRVRFSTGTADGDFVLDLVQRGDLLFVEDVAAHPLVSPHTTGYTTVIAVAVTSGPQRLGMLTVDAPRPGDLTATDVELVRVLANLLGAGLAQA
jgi:putative methionine-R-sulfoxide reductase with GAF domain